MYQDTSTYIDAPPSAVWQVLIDVERMAGYSDSVTDVKLLTAGPLAVGSRARILQPKLRPATWRVTALDPGHSFSWTTKATGVTTVANHVLVAEGPGTRVTLSIALTGWLSRPLAALGGKLIGRYIAMEAAGLRTTSEARQEEAGTLG